MANLSEEEKQKLLNTLDELESEASLVKFAIKKKLQVLEPVKIMPFYGFASENYVYLKGRVLEREKIRSPRKVNSMPEQWLNMWKRLESDEIPGAKLKASFNGRELDLETDQEGYFDVEIHTQTPLNFEQAGTTVKLQLQEQYTDKDQKDAEGYLFVPDKHAEFGVISDIDDTVLVSHVKQFMGRMRLMLKENATERHPFPGIAGFLRALCKGSDGQRQNPLFFVSGSTWNIYDLLISFLRSHHIPEGPLLLRDRATAWDHGKFETSEQAYKLEKVRHILDTYPWLKFICIGDSGQHDPETYQQIVQEYPGRILGIYIRDVSPDGRDTEVRNMARQVQEQGVEMKLVEETLSAARHAAERGWIHENELEDVRQARAKDEQQDT
ncbi:phosphatidate phosphatase APP1 [Pontibacter ummariensis]|uniref:Phosphatidate phosphatase APP1 n=1 Tax=Pontibacter ummariensis TaxID=1610492 RepID=A0A239CXS1_9BACT|nr:phosphatase domain-containing protein [Pontibacter ummariensis]PRY14793.1 phosphatidate phosphatase APP1 [Pontibacter ummariensis]SNS24344.1 Phosphatidate phosphatase APP1 [Pontibacter ummariensis]